MKEELDYLKINKETWNTKTDVHYTSEFYRNERFITGETSLNEIELELLGDVSGKRILHLQCHFGQDTLSLARMGAEVTGVDLSDKAIDRANNLAKEIGENATFICCDVYSLKEHLDEKFDIVFTSYGTIGWLPDMNRWADIVAHFIKPGGQFIFAEFHPVVWMFDDDFTKVGYNYFNDGAIIEEEQGTYTDRDANIKNKTVWWNHGMGEVISSLVKAGVKLEVLNEYDYSPYNCFNGVEEFEKGKYRIEKIGNKIPMVYALSAKK